MINYQPRLGPPTKLNDEIHKIIIDAIAGNAPYDVAAWKARINPSTLYDWIKRGAADDELGLTTEFTQLAKAIKETEADKIIAHLKSCEDREERWQARMTILERRWREYFGSDARDLKEVNRLVEELVKANGDSNGKTDNEVTQKNPKE
jgi:hypothetical protein